MSYKNSLAVFCTAVSLMLNSATAQTLEDLMISKGIITKSEAQRITTQPASKVYWNKGTRMEFPNEGFTTQINVFLQERYTFTDADEEAGKKNSSSFDTNKARLIVSGTALGGEFDYNITTDFVGGRDDSGAKSPVLLDAYLNWKPCDRTSIKMGQWKTGISRQFVAGDQYLQFADRSTVSNFFNLGRQTGAQGTVKLDQTTVSAAIFNGLSDGEGINRSGVDTQQTGILNLRSDVLGKQAVAEEGDIDGTQDLALNVGAAYAYSESDQTVANLTDEYSQHIVNIDANLKVMGFSTHTEIYWERQDGDQSDASEPLGGYIQLGYFVMPQELEIAARYSHLDCDKGTARGGCVGKDRVDQGTLGINYYWWKHHLKAQLNYDFENQDLEEWGDQTTERWILQLSAYL